VCIKCWRHHGSPAIDNGKVRQASELIAGVYLFSGVGGNLHTLLDDFNIEDNTSEYVKYQENTGAAQELVERECLRILNSITLDEKASAIALYFGWWNINK